MKLFNEIKLFIQDSLEIGKETVYFIILGNLALIFGFMLKGSTDIIGLIMQMSFLTMFIPFLFTLRKYLSN